MSAGESSKEEGMRRQGSVRRVVHNDCVLAPARSLTPSFNSSACPVSPLFLQEYAIISEFNMVCDRYIPDLYVIPSAKSSLKWFGVFFITEGPFRDGIYRFTLLLPEAFPCSSTPRIICDGKIWHPNIEESTGEVDLGLEWKKDVNYVREALERLKDIFVQPDTSIMPSNPNAFDLYNTNFEEFENLAQECAQRSRDDLFTASEEEDPHYLRFEQFDPAVHGEALNILTGVKSQSQGDDEVPNSLDKCKGISWVRQGSLRPLSKMVS